MPSQVIFFSQGRTGCHLLERMLSKQPKTQYLWHPCAPARPSQYAFLADESVKSGSSDENRRTYTKLLEAGVSDWQNAFEATQKANECLFIHEHPQFAIDPDRAVRFATTEWNSGIYNGGSNYTMIPDEVLLRPGTSVIMNLRHPAHVVVAAYRGLRDLEHGADRLNVILITTLRWQREMYDWFVSKGIKPVLAESEDYMTSPDFVKKLCKEAGLDPDHAIFSWPKATEEELANMNPMYAKLLWSLLHSDGLNPSYAKKRLDFDVELAKWKEEFGEDIANFLREEVEASMPHYEYLRAKKLTM